MTRPMTHSPTHGLHIRRVQLRPILPDRTSHIKRKSDAPAHPLVIRQSYDFSAACVRHGEDAENAPLLMHIRGEQEIPLLRCAVIGAAAVGVMLGAAVVLRIRRDWQLRHKYARRYADRLKELRYRNKLQKVPTEPKPTEIPRRH